MSSDRGSFREIEHTADLGIEVTASSLAGLFSTAGEALFAFIADPKSLEAREAIAVAAGGDGPEELLHAWLRELLAQFNLTGFVAARCEVRKITRERVEGIVTGEKLDLKRHRFYTEIKGVTYHDFRVWEENGSWRARVIFDV
ncbi:MAG TPA: archease [Candidatus Acidoferrales bacterium]|jgi:SHS2 domain-containing protein|nr:archease [Candidatus Acidoferrales bacterium]